MKRAALLCAPEGKTAPLGSTIHSDADDAQRWRLLCQHVGFGMAGGFHVDLDGGNVHDPAVVFSLTAKIDTLRSHVAT